MENAGPQQSVAVLRVANEAFLVASTIERCPKTMMMRELFVNAIESALLAPIGGRRVEIGSVMVNDARKLAFWNTGPGLDAAELRQICDLASSLNKSNSLEGNFGMGAKVASLPSNKLGLRYRSCKNGSVSEVVLCQRDGIYGRLIRGHRADGSLIDVVDATETCGQEGRRDLGIDWTEVVLFGNHVQQDTVRNPYDNNPAVQEHWVTEYLDSRFFRLPPSVDVTLSTGGMPQGYQALQARRPGGGRSETVETASRIRLHYRFAAPGAVGAFGGNGAVIYRDEIYAFRDGLNWIMDAVSCGIPFGARFISVHVELPEGYPVRADGYRQFLRLNGGDQRNVRVSEFATLIRANIPAWLRAIIEAAGPPRADHLDRLTDELRALMADLNLVLEQAVAPPVTAVQGGGGGGAAEPDRVRPPATAGKPTMAPPPEVIGLSDADLIDEKGLTTRAGKFYPGSNQIFINLRYPAILRLSELLSRRGAGDIPPSVIDSYATQAAEWLTARNIARLVIHTMAKRNEKWSGEDMGRSQSAETLSVVADNFGDTFSLAAQRLDQALTQHRARERDAAVAAATLRVPDCIAEGVSF